MNETPCCAFAISCGVFPDIFLSHPAKYTVFLCNVAYLHNAVWIFLIFPEWNCYIPVTVQIPGYDSRTECISVQTNHQIQHRRSVAHSDRSGIFILAQNFLCQIIFILVLLKGMAPGIIPYSTSPSSLISINS